MRFLLIYVMCLLAAVSAPARAGVYVTGSVFDTTGIKPAPGISVGLYSADQVDPLDITTTLTNGSFLLRAPAAGSYRVAARGEDRLSASESVHVPASGLANLKLQLSAPRPLRITMLDADGHPILANCTAQCWVTLTNGRSMPIDVSGPSAGGLIVIPQPDQVPPERVLGVVVEARWGDLCGRLRLDHWPADPLTMRLRQGAVLQGQVINAQGLLAAGATVQVLSTNDSFFRKRWGPIEARADENGVFRVPSLLPGRYVVLARIPNGGAREQLVDVPNDGARVLITGGDPVPVVALLGKRGIVQEWAGSPLAGKTPDHPAVHGRIVRADGTPAANVKVELLRTIISPAANGVTGTDGIFMMTAPVPGRYILVLTPPGAAEPLRGMIQVPEAGIKLNDISTQAALPLTLHLITSAGKPLANTRVRLECAIGDPTTYPRGLAASLITDATGMIAIPELQAVAMDSVIRISARVAGVGTGSITINKPPTRPVPLPMNAGSVLTGKVVNYAGQAVPGATVSVGKLPAPDEYRVPAWIDTAPTSADGVFHLNTLAPGSYAVSVTAPGGAIYRPTPVTIGANETYIVVNPRFRPALRRKLKQ